MAVYSDLALFVILLYTTKGNFEYLRLICMVGKTTNNLPQHVFLHQVKGTNNVLCLGAYYIGLKGTSLVLDISSQRHRFPYSNIYQVLSLNWLVVLPSLPTGRQFQNVITLTVRLFFFKPFNFRPKYVYSHFIQMYSCANIVFYLK